MWVRMLVTRHGTEDGWLVHRFHAGQVYALAGHLAARFLLAGAAERVSTTNCQQKQTGENGMGHASLRMVRRDVPPATEPLSLAEAKLYLRVDGNTDDSLITDMIAAVREAAEDYMRRSLITQGWALVYDDYAPLCTPLVHGPVQGVSDVTIMNRAGEETVIDDSLYALNAAHSELRFDSVVMGHQVKVRYVAGHGDAVDVPESIRQGMLMHLAALYDNRLTGATLPPATIVLYQPFREMRLA